MKKPSCRQLPLLLVLPVVLSGCVGMVVETVTDTAIAVAKVPFKVGAAVIDVASGDDDGDAPDADK